MRLFRPAALLGFALAAVPCASASLILDNSSPFSLIAIDKPPAILTIHGPANGDVSSGCVGWDGIGDVIGAGACAGPGSSGGNEVRGAALTAALTLSEAGIRSAADLRVALSVERRPHDRLIVENLVLRVISPEGSTLFTSGPFLTTLVVTDRLPRYKFGFLFRLSSEDLASIPSVVFENGHNHLSLSATVAGSSRGLDRFSILSVDSGPPEPVPEPDSFVLAATALLAAFFLRRRPGR